MPAWRLWISSVNTVHPDLAVPSRCCCQEIATVRVSTMKLFRLLPCIAAVEGLLSQLQQRQAGRCGNPRCLRPWHQHGGTSRAVPCCCRLWCCGRQGDRRTTPGLPHGGALLLLWVRRWTASIRDHRTLQTKLAGGVVADNAASGIGASGLSSTKPACFVAGAVVVVDARNAVER